MKKETLYGMPVNEELIWDYEWKEEDYKTRNSFTIRQKN